MGADHLLLIAATLLFSSLLCRLLFRRRTTGHLRLPPGPKGWPILGNLLQLGSEPIHRTLSAFSKKYGPLVRLRLGSVDVVVAASASVAAEFLRTHDANFRNRPSSSTAEYSAYNYQDLTFAPYGPRWRMMRKLCALHLFSPKTLNDLRPVRAEEVAMLVQTLHEHSRNRLSANLAELLVICTTNALTRAMLGLRVFSKGTGIGDAAEFKDMVMENARLAGEFNVVDFVPALRWLDPQGLVGKLKKLHRRFDSFLDKVIEEHRAAAAGRGEDLLSVLIRLKEEEVDSEGAKMTDTNIKALLQDLFIGGAETSSATVEWALTEMIRHPNILRKAQMELDSMVGRDRLVTEEDLPNLSYLQAIAKETLRHHPPAPLSLPHTASEACEINGYHIPARTTLLVNVWAIGHDPAVWADPLEFRPDRFLLDGGYENLDVKGNDFELIPFGAGRRICVGMGLGLKMVQFLTATLIHAFDWALPEGMAPEELDMEEAFGLTLHKAVPLLVHPTPRLAHEVYANVS